MALSEILASDKDVALNWRVLRNLIARDAEHWQSMADSDEWTEHTKAKMAGKVEAARQILESMCTLEYGAETTLSFPVDAMITAAALAEHTAAACDTITRAAR